MQLYLNVREPLILTGKQYMEYGKLYDAFEKEGISRMRLINFGWEQLDGDEGKHFVDAAKKLGFDGIVFNEENPDTGNEMETWAVFDPSQIKSIYE